MSNVNVNYLSNSQCGSLITTYYVLGVGLTYSRADETYTARRKLESTRDSIV